jgi:hypothetical protein
MGMRGSVMMQVDGLRRGAKITSHFAAGSFINKLNDNLGSILHHKKPSARCSRQNVDLFLHSP